VGNGEPKQKILEDLLKKYRENMFIIKTLESTPSVTMKKKYFYCNVAVFVLLLSIFVFDLLLLAKLFFPDWFSLADSDYAVELEFLNVFFVLFNLLLDILLLIGIALYRMEAYSWIAARAVFSLLQIIAVNAVYHFIDPLSYYTLGLLLVSFIAGLFMSVKLSPRRIPKTIELVNSENETIKKTIYVFPD
jgi:hypothetical protein